jgi:hypothetical protein
VGVTCKATATAAAGQWISAGDTTKSWLEFRVVRGGDEELQGIEVLRAAVYGVAVRWWAGLEGWSSRGVGGGGGDSDT